MSKETLYAPQWALAIKNSLGDTWHIGTQEGTALCSKRIRLDEMDAVTEKPNARCCNRCAVLAKAEAKP